MSHAIGATARRSATSAPARRRPRTHGGPLRGIKTFLSSRPGFARNTAIIVAAILVGIVAAALIISQEQLILPWQSSHTYYATFSDASAVAPGQHQEVRVAGIHVGQIGSATVTSGGQARVQLRITDTNLKVYANATALLQAKTPLNEMYVSLSPGSPAAPLLGDGQTIPVEQTESPNEIDQLLDHFGPNQQNAQRILLSESNIALDGAAPALTQDLSRIDTTTTALQPVSAALATRQAEIKELVTDLGTIATAVGGNDQQLAALLDHAQTTLTTLSTNDAALRQTLSALPGASDALGTALPKVQALSGQLNPFLQNLRAADTALPPALSTLSTTVQQLKPVLDEVDPVIASGTPLISGTKALLVDANPALADLTQITPLLNPITAYLGYDAPWLQGFFFHTASLGSLTVNTTNPANGDPEREQVIRALVGQGTSSLQSTIAGTPLASLCPEITSVSSSLGGVSAPSPTGGSAAPGGILAGVCG